MNGNSSDNNNYRKQGRLEGENPPLRLNRRLPNEGNASDMALTVSGLLKRSDVPPGRVIASARRIFVARQYQRQDSKAEPLPITIIPNIGCRWSHMQSTPIGWANSPIGDRPQVAIDALQRGLTVNLIATARASFSTCALDETISTVVAQNKSAGCDLLPFL